MSEKVRSALAAFFKGKQQMQTVACKVTEVNTDDYTIDCEPIDGGAAYYHVRLRATRNGDTEGVIPIPVIGSFVIIGIIGNSDSQAIVLLCEKVQTYMVMCTDIQLNGTTHKGLVKIDALVQKLNIIEAKHNELIATFNAHVHSALNVVPAPLSTAVITKQTIIDELENKNVQHG